MPYNVLGDLQTLTLGDNVECSNPCVILTKDNVVQMMGDLGASSYSSGSTLAVLPESMRPTDEQLVPVAITEGDVRTLAFMVVGTDGVVSLNADIGNGKVHTSGVDFNVCSKYYNSEIGNNFPQGTSPLEIQ